MARIRITAVTAIADGYGCRYASGEIAEVSDELATAWVAAGHATYADQDHVDQLDDGLVDVVDTVDQRDVDKPTEPGDTPDGSPVKSADEPTPELASDNAKETGPAVEQQISDQANPPQQERAATTTQPAKQTRRAPRTAARRPAPGGDEK